VVDPSGLAAWTAQLNAGTSREQVVAAIANSLEFRMEQAQGLYRNLLGRPADAAGLADLVAFLSGGGTLEGAAVRLTSSDEYFQVRGGATLNGFVTALFNDALHRPVDAGFLAALDGDPSRQPPSRQQLAEMVFGSEEYQRDLVQGYYEQALHRTADDSGLAGWVSLLRSGSRDEQVLAGIEGSDEFFTHLQAAAPA
jgi:hypothetical protein